MSLRGIWLKTVMVERMRILRYRSGGGTIVIGTKCYLKLLRMCWLYQFPLLHLSQHLALEVEFVDPFRSSLSPLMVQNLVCSQNWLQARVPISHRQSRDDVEALEEELLDLGNMLKF